MFVRWQRRERTRTKRGTGQYVLTAALVKSEWINGQSRQEFVGYLGTIHERAVDKPLPAAKFWRTVNAKLDTLNLDRETRTTIEADIARRVAVPDPVKVAEAETERDEIRAAIHAAMENRPKRSRRRSTP